MYASGDLVARLESVRRELDPVQFGLIPAHVTLCREDELAALPDDELGRRIAGAPSLALEFGLPEAFSGHGILLPCVRGEATFHALRRRVLGGEPARHPQPHLTLAHPRNPRAPGNSLAVALALPDVISLTFLSVHRIVQHGGGPWAIERTFLLAP
jgi:hypothetical protein